MGSLRRVITIWLPTGASQRLVDHEDGHRQISEYFYQAADQVARRAAANHMDNVISISGSNLQAETNKALQQLSSELNDEYNKRLDPEPAQLEYDAITSHGRNDVVVKDAVAHVLKEATTASLQR